MEIFERYSYTVLDRFCRYVAIDTQSDPYSGTSPSTEKQKNLGTLLVAELQQLGLDDAELDEHGYVYATIPKNTSKDVPVICFCSHMDTSPDCSGKGVKPIIHPNYQGQDLVLPDDPAQVLSPSNHPELLNQIGNDIITASGTTLLGADNKAGVAEIMDAAAFLVSHPELAHGDIKILFTPDEEIGRGVDNVDLAKVGANYAYTIDGESRGTFENETFSADAAVITIKGVSAHPGLAKGHMESALKIASEIIQSLPKDKLSPESTEGRQGFIHPTGIRGTVEEASIDFILRDFDNQELAKHGLLLSSVCNEVMQKYPNSGFTIDIKQQYRNMKSIIERHPYLTTVAEKAIERAGMTPRLQYIRGGTDGSRLSFMGLPCPNVFAGEHAFHGKQEWVSLQDMKLAVQTIVNIALIWEEVS